MHKLIQIDDADPAIFDKNSVDHNSIDHAYNTEGDFLAGFKAPTAGLNLKQYLYVSISDSEQGTYIFEDSCLVEDLEDLVMDMIDVYGENSDFLCLDEYVALYVDAEGNEVNLDGN